MRILIIPVLCAITCGMDAQDMKTKDGVSLGDRKEFMETCTSTAKEKVVNMQGVKINIKNYCSCVAENLIPKITYGEFLGAVNSDSLMHLFMRPDLLQELLDCTKGQTKIEDDFQFDASTDSEIARLAAKQECINAIKQDPSAAVIFSGDKAERYCDCAISKMYENGYSYEQISEASNPESVVYKEVVLPCVNSVLELAAAAPPENVYSASDIRGNAVQTSIPVQYDNENNAMVDLIIAGETVSFYFDDETTDVIISEELQRELIFRHPELMMTFIGTKDFQMTETEYYTANMMKVESLRVGDYEVQNLIIAVIPDMPPILGAGLLQKFSSWEMNEKGHFLILKK